MARKERWLKKVEILLKNAGVSMTENPTNILFVSNSSVMCGVELEDLEAAFHPYDAKCTFLVYPKYKSYSFAIFSGVSCAEMARRELNNTQPSNFPKEIALFFVTNLPNETLSSPTKLLSGLNISSNFVTVEEESDLVRFIESSDCANMKNRRVLHFGYTFDYSENCAFAPAKQIPPILDRLVEKVSEHHQVLTGSQHEGPSTTTYRFRPDQITVNVYEAGQGIPPHVDTHSAFEEPIISLSLCSDVVMEFRDCANLRDITGVLLPARSLMVMCGAARYRYKHGILSRKYDVNPENNRLIHRQKRISITFRQIRRVPCECPFVEFCDWDRRGRMAVPDTNFEGRNLESEYVSKVYDEIADHFDETRKSNWGVVNKFLDGLPEQSVVLDAGCGNGKYLIREDALCKIGGDLCENLVRIAHDKNCRVFRGDALALPIRSASVDAALSIAVIHHFSTRERRLRALRELARILRPGGLACVTVWAMEQSENAEESAYARMRNLRENFNTDGAEELSSNFKQDPIVGGLSNLQEESSNCSESGVMRRLRVHDGRSTFSQQDMLVPWNLKSRPASLNTSADLEKNSNSIVLQENAIPSRQFLRYYHLFVDGELAELVEELTDCRLKHVKFEEGNWAVIFEKN